MAQFSPLKRTNTSPSHHSPQLSERDSIFATHYLPSDHDLPPRHVSAVSASDSFESFPALSRTSTAPQSLASPSSDAAREMPPPPLPQRRETSKSGAEYRRSSSKSRPRVEKSIEASLADANPSPNVRSRKSSHFLGLFKENTKTKKREEPEQLDGRRLSLTQRPRLPHTITTPVAEHPHETIETKEKTPNIDIPVAPRTPKPLPLELLDEIRNYHETTSGILKHGSPPLSRSVPTPVRDRSTQLYRFGNTPSPKTDADRARRESPERTDEEDNDNEHISSALYFPHRRTLPEGMEDSLLEEPERDESNDNLLPQHDGNAMEEFTPEPEAADQVDISLRSMGDNRILHGGLRRLKVAPSEVSESTLATPSESAYDSVSEAESVSEYESESANDRSGHADAGTTPTATSHLEKYVEPEPEPPQPLGAVELKPYRHQVGGHTTVFRFSRRAVCKQLNNRENVFYERIERRHPEMLMFLPRFVVVLDRRILSFLLTLVGTLASSTLPFPKARRNPNPSPTRMETPNHSGYSVSRRLPG